MDCPGEAFVLARDPLHVCRNSFLWTTEELALDPFDPIITFKGFTGHAEALRALAESDVLVLWGNRGGLQVPAKVFEYIGARRPILAVLGDEDDPLQPILAGLNRGIMVPNREEEIVPAVLNLCSLWREGSLDRSFDLDDRPEYQWSAAGEKLERILVESTC